MFLAAVPAAADAAPHRTHHRRIDSVTVRPDGQGSVIAITFAGQPQPRILKSAEPLASYALADVDNDGALDIVATSPRHGLVVWHNAGRGRFILTLPSRIRNPSPTSVGVKRLARVDEGLLAPDDRYDAPMPRAPAVGHPDPVTTVFSSAPSFTPATPSAQWSGRAPPTPSH